MLGLAIEFSVVVAIFVVAHQRQSRQRPRRPRAKQLSFEFPSDKRRKR